MSRVLVLDPSFAVQNLDLPWIDALVVIKSLEALIPKLKQEMPLYLAKCSGTTFRSPGCERIHQGHPPLLENIRRRVSDMGAGDADRWLVYADLSSCRACVLSPKVMFGDLQDRALSDYLHRPH
eukprot:6833222-Prymnesium_polylepis.1